ncbi:hypothetical protein I4U23_018978 [Adineta vaga]|nr:hypothetical protein I4U23_018978 [Adineta vaga]
MNLVFLIILISSIPFINSSYNPIPNGSVIISTTHTISILLPQEFDGFDKITVIFSAPKNLTIINTIFDSITRDFYILYNNKTNNLNYICRLVSVEKLDSIAYQLPFSFNISDINQLTTFTSDTVNKRAFLTDQNGTVTIFSMSGTMKKILRTPSTIDSSIRSVSYNPSLNRLFIITDSTVNSCTNLDRNDLQCCQASPKGQFLRSIAFDPLSSTTYIYVMDERSGVYQVVLDNITHCPITLRPINAMGSYKNNHLAIYQDLYFCSGSVDTSNHYSILIIGKELEMPRTISFDAAIVALHISYPNMKSLLNDKETCFHGITYHDYRVAVVLAAIFGTVMGIFMCFNALFCIDFFMTKRIIRDLRRQIPHNLLEDRWNKLVNEKYAKLALELHRKKDDPPIRRKSSVATRKILTSENVQFTSGGDTYQVANPIPRISTYLRRKSESYLVRSRRNNESRSLSRTNDRYVTVPNKPNVTTAVPRIHIEEANNEDQNEKQPFENVNHDDLAKTNAEIL